MKKMPDPSARMRAFIAAAAVGLATVAFHQAAQPLEAAQARNVILMIGDGASYGSYAAASYYQHGALGQQIFDSFDVQYAMSTYNFNGSYDPALAADSTFIGGSNFFQGYAYLKDRNNVTDSAEAATAIGTGVKTSSGAINWSPPPQNEPLKSIFQYAKEWGRNTGTISDVQFSHATPAAFGAHSPTRGDGFGIAQQMLNNGLVDVVMGAGHPGFDDDGQPRGTNPATWPYIQVGGRTEWEMLTGGTHPGNWTYIETKEQFEDLASGALIAPKLFGVPQVARTLQQKRSGSNTDVVFGDPPVTNVPDLATMARGTLNVLNQNPNGFFVMIEGGTIDMAGHSNQKGRIIEEHIAFHDAIEAVVAWVEANSSWNETLLIVTSDHDTGLPLGPDSDTIAFQPVQNNGQGMMPDFRFHDTRHSNDLVPLFAHGAGADLFHQFATGIDPRRGAYIDNTDVFHVMYNAMVPEPGAVSLLAAAALALPRRRRRTRHAESISVTRHVQATVTRFKPPPLHRPILRTGLGCTGDSAIMHTWPPIAIPSSSSASLTAVFMRSVPP